MFTDMIALPDLSAGAMENWGLITYRETYLLYQEGMNSAERKQAIASIIAHELAHQVCVLPGVPQALTLSCTTVCQNSNPFKHLDPKMNSFQFHLSV